MCCCTGLHYVVYMKYNAVRYCTITNYVLNDKKNPLFNTAMTMSTKLNVIGIIKVDFMVFD